MYDFSRADDPIHREGEPLQEYVQKVYRLLNDALTLMRAHNFGFIEVIATKVDNCIENAYSEGRFADRARFARFEAWATERSGALKEIASAYDEFRFEIREDEYDVMCGDKTREEAARDSAESRASWQLTAARMTARFAASLQPQRPESRKILLLRQRTMNGH